MLTNTFQSFDCGLVFQSFQTDITEKNRKEHVTPPETSGKNREQKINKI